LTLRVPSRSLCVIVHPSNPALLLLLPRWVSPAAGFVALRLSVCSASLLMKAVGEQ
jgi:hypothetical protein